VKKTIQNLEKEYCITQKTQRENLHKLNEKRWARKIFKKQKQVLEKGYEVAI
jgi:hypothetical protein